MRTETAALLALALLGCPKGPAPAEKPKAAAAAAAAAPSPARAPAPHVDKAPLEPIPAGLAPTWPYLESEGFRGPTDLRAFLDVPEAKQGRLHAWVARAMGDAPTEMAIWKRLAAQDPSDIDAALRVIELQVAAKDHGALEAAQALVASMALFESTWRGKQASYEAQHLLCRAAWEFDDLKLAKKSCLDVLPFSASKSVLETFALFAIDASDGMASVRSGDGAVAMERHNADLWFLDAAANEVGRHIPEFHSALEKALRIEPRHEPALRTYLELDKTPAQRIAAFKAWHRRAYLDGLVRCADTYAAVGLGERGEPCLAALEAADAEWGRFARLQVLSRTDAAGAAQKLTALLAKATPKSSNALVCAATVYLANHDTAHAAPLADQALAADPTNLDAEDLVTAAGGHPAKPLPRLAKQREAVPLATLDDLVATPPLFKHVTLTPYSEAPIPELNADLVASLHATYPGIEFSIEPLQPVPPSSSSGTHLIAETMLAHTPDEPGRIAVVTSGLVTLAGGFGFGSLDPYSSRGVASVNRLRSPMGQPTDDAAAPSEATLAVSRTRLREELVSTVGKLLGMSSPCLQSHCALRAPRDMAAFDADGPELCALHRDELTHIFEPIDAHPKVPPLLKKPDGPTKTPAGKK